MRIDPQTVLAGHLSVPASAAAGSIVRTDVTDYVASCAGTNATFVVVRRFRNELYTGNAGGDIPADLLSGGSVARFASKEAAASSQPNLKLLMAPVPAGALPAPPPPPAPRYTGKATIVVGMPGAAPSGRHHRHLLQAAGDSLAIAVAAVCRHDTSPADVSADIMAYQISGALLVSGPLALADLNTPAVHSALDDGLAADLNASLSQLEASAAACALALARTRRSV